LVNVKRRDYGLISGIFIAISSVLGTLPSFIPSSDDIIEDLNAQATRELLVEQHGDAYTCSPVVTGNQNDVKQHMVDSSPDT